MMKISKYRRHVFQNTGQHLRTTLYVEVCGLELEKKTGLVFVPQSDPPKCSCSLIYLPVMAVDRLIDLAERNKT